MITVNIECPDCGEPQSVELPITATQCSGCKLHIVCLKCTNCPTSFLAANTEDAVTCPDCGHSRKHRRSQRVPLSMSLQVNSRAESGIDEFHGVVIDGLGWSPQVGALVSVKLRDTGLELSSKAAVGSGAKVNVEYSKLRDISVSGFSSTKSAGIIGGGFGPGAAMEGMAIAALINRTSRKTSMWVIVSIDGTEGRMTVQINDAREDSMRRVLRPAQDKIRAMFEGKGSSSSTALYEDGDDLIGKLERLARLRSDGVLNEEEFQKAKSRIID